MGRWAIQTCLWIKQQGSNKYRIFRIISIKRFTTHAMLPAIVCTLPALLRILTLGFMPFMVSKPFVSYGSYHETKVETPTLLHVPDQPVQRTAAANPDSVGLVTSSITVILSATRSALYTSELATFTAIELAHRDQSVLSNTKATVWMLLKSGFTHKSKQYAFDHEMICL